MKINNRLTSFLDDIRLDEAGQCEERVNHKDLGRSHVSIQSSSRSIQEEFHGHVHNNDRRISTAPTPHTERYTTATGYLTPKFLSEPPCNTETVPSKIARYHGITPYVTFPKKHCRWESHQRGRFCVSVQQSVFTSPPCTHRLLQTNFGIIQREQKTRFRVWF